MGTVTIEGTTVTKADVSVDMHTAGHSADSALSTNMHYLPDPGLRKKTMDATASFMPDAPCSAVSRTSCAGLR